jgi:RNA polymerase sigma factor (TIGR02999 family)
MNDSREQVTQLLVAWRGGDAEALETLTPLVYDELHRLARHHMRKEHAGHTLQTTALVHEAFARLVGAGVDWQDRVHFFSVASSMMRRILVDHARAQRSEKRGGGVPQLPLNDELVGHGDRGWDIVDLDLALDRLNRISPRQVRALELRFFGGLSNDEIGKALDISNSTARGDIRLAKAWIRRELSGSDEG